MDDLELDVLLNRLKNPGTTAYPDYKEPGSTKKLPTPPAVPSTTNPLSGRPEIIKPSQIKPKRITDTGTGGQSAFQAAKYVKHISGVDYNYLLSLFKGNEIKAQEAVINLKEDELQEMIDKQKAFEKPDMNLLVGTGSGFDFFKDVLGINGISDLLKVDGDSRIPDLEPPAYNPYDMNTGQSKPKDNSFWEEHPDYYKIALEKAAQQREEKRKAQEAEDKFNRDLENKIPGWADMSSYEQKQIKDLISKTNERLATFPQEFVELYERREEIQTDLNALEIEKLNIPSQILDLEGDIAVYRAERKGMLPKINLGALPYAIMNAIISFWALQGVIINPYALIDTAAASEACASFGYDIDDFIDNSARKAKTDKITAAEDKIKQLGWRQEDIPGEINDLKNELSQINRKLDRKYPGMSERYRNRAN